MKKYVAILFCLAALLVAGVLCTSALTQEVGCWVENAKNVDEILAGEAGEREIGWEVPFLMTAPEIDGKIERGEYMPFELYEDYLSWMAMIGNDADPSVGGTTEEEFMEFYNSTRQDFFDAWWGWDGTYMYVAFEINCINGYKCSPEQNVLLYAENCLQVGIADVNAEGKDASYVELGCGVHDQTGEQIVFNWVGNYCPEAGTDVMSIYDEENQILVYEMRIHLQSALGLDRLVENGDEINYAWLLSVNGHVQTVNELWQLAFCHGIGGPYSSKCTQYFARVAFMGKPDDLVLTPEDIPGMSEEDREYGLFEFVDLSKEDTVKTFEAENALVDYVTENGVSFMRITSLGGEDNLPVAYSNVYPKNVLGDAVGYLVVKYRTSFADAEDLGVVFRTVHQKDYNFDDCYYEYIDGDGAWHTAVFYMNEDLSWTHYIMNIGFVPFLYADSSVQETIDIAWLKFYVNDPTELYENYEEIDGEVTEDGTADLTEDTTDAADGEDTQVPDGDATQAPDENQTQAIEETTAKPSEETAAPADETTSSEETTQAPDGAATETDVDILIDKKGCGSSVGFGLAALLTAMAAAVVLKKKD